MRILLINDNHTMLGGAERYFFELKSRLQNEKNVEVFSIGFGDKEEIGKDYVVLKKTSTKPHKFFWQLFLNKRVYRELQLHISQFKPDVIHLHNVKEYTRSVLKALHPYPVIQTIHDYSVICPMGWNVHKNLKVCTTGIRFKCFWQHQTKFNKFTYLLIAISQHWLKKRLQKSINAFISPSLLLSNYLELNQFKNVATISHFINESKTTDDKIESFHFLFIGQLGQHKGVYHLLNEFARASSTQPKLRLTIVGNGPLLSSMQAKIKILGLEKQIVCVGWQNDLSTYYAKCQAVIFPSIGLESFGLVITESMSAGRVVVASDRGNSSQLIEDKVTGFLYDPLKEGELAQCLLRVVAEPEIAKQMGECARYKVKEIINNEKVMKQILNCYERLISARNSSS